MGTLSFLSIEFVGGVEADLLPRFSLEELLEVVFAESLVCKANRMSS